MDEYKFFLFVVYSAINVTSNCYETVQQYYSIRKGEKIQGKFCLLCIS